MTSENSVLIQPIGREAVHRICSGQVVLSLAIAVKELVENAIDAGATIIDIQLKEYGSEVIEVCDNGTGVEKNNFQALTLKHYTSKIKQFDDLTTLLTLGFRGEALSSLCALSDLSILTKSSTAENATKIKYDRNGKILSETLAAREKGTTVTLENLFSTLPVRRKEFMKNLKREFNRMCQLLYAYCLVSKGIKFSCSNTTKNKKNIVVATDGLETVKENIINVFGAKQIATLIEVEIIKPEEPILGEFGVNLVEGEPLPFSFDLLISSVTHGSGRSTNDRQFYYINSRPCEPTKVIKLINEIYKQYNNSQHPFVFLNISSNACLVDVNVTPDKRQIFLEKEKVLLATIKASLIEAFKNFPSTFKMQNLELSQNTSIKDFIETKRGLKRSMTEGSLKKGGLLEKFKKRSKTENDKESLSSTAEHTNTASESVKDDNLIPDAFLVVAKRICEKETNARNGSTEENKVVKKETLERVSKEQFSEINKIENDSQSKLGECTEERKIVCDNERKVESVVTIRKDDDSKFNLMQSVKGIKDHPKLDSAENITTDTDQVKNESKKTANIENSIFDDDVELVIDTSVRDYSNYKSLTLNITLDDIKKSIKNKIKRDEINNVKVRFRSKINPESNKAAEEELQKQISKEDFNNMTIIGQFNLGFIIARLRNDLFIIDQHATDEKYNFERLQANTVMENQILVNPKPLQLTAADESLLIENEDIFKKNGFHFKIDESAPCTKKVFLTSVPLSKSIIFGKDDIDEMLFMLRDSNRTMCRPSRLRAMFASRACRKSVMIGNFLSDNDMRRLINHMGEIEQPWNCPHGRPTMRHLINLDLIHQEEM